MKKFLGVSIAAVMFVLFLPSPTVRTENIISRLGIIQLMDDQTKVEKNIKVKKPLRGIPILRRGIPPPEKKIVHFYLTD